MYKKPTYLELEMRVQELETAESNRNKIEASLRESEERYKGIFKYTKSGIAAYKAIDDGNDFVFMDFNKAAEKIENINRDEIIGKSVLQLFPGIKEFGLFDVFQRVWKTGKPEYHPITMYKDHRIIGWRDNFVYKLPSGEIVAVYSDETERKLAEVALKEHKERFDLLIEHTGAYTWEVSTDGLYTHYGKTAQGILGYRPEEIIGKIHFYDLYPEEERDKFKADAFEVFAHKKAFQNLEKQIQIKSGGIIWVSTSAIPIFNAEGSLKGYWGIDIDITERKRYDQAIKHSENRFKTILGTSFQGFCFLDTNKIITEINDSLCTIFDREREDIVGKSYFAFMDEQGRKTVQEQMKMRQHGKSGIYELNFIRPDGSAIPCMVHGTPMLDLNGEVTGTFGMITDMSEINRTKQKLTKAIKTAEAASRIKSDFLANMSHEIRTPMNGVIGMTELLLGTELTDEQIEFAETIKVSSDSLLSIINDILDFSKIEAGKFNLEIIKFDLRVTLDTVRDIIAIKAHEKGLEYVTVVSPDVPSLVRGDPGRLRQILVNLVSNSIKFTHTGEVVIYVDLEKETKNWVQVRFTVKDTGIGIPKDKINLLFKSFSQLDSSTTRKYGGSGLGLTISKKLAHMMQGKIGVDSEVGQGSEFWFTVKLEKQKVLSELPISLPGNIKGKYILIVDDNKTNRFVIKEQLKRWGCQYKEAQNGFIAIEELIQAVHDKTPFDMAIIDMQMPGMDGKQLGKKIKKNPDIANTHLIMMSSIGERGDAKRLEQIGFDAYLKKPTKLEQLYNCLIKVYNRSGDLKKATPDSIITQYVLTEEERMKIRILLAEDNHINQKVALKMLFKIGYHVDAVVNGKEALDALKEKDYDLVLMDCQMPELDGFNATKEIRNPDSSVKNRDIPIIAMTANAMKGDRDICIEAGMDDYLTKPVKIKELSQMLNKWLTKKH